MRIFVFFALALTGIAHADTSALQSKLTGFSAAIGVGEMNSAVKVNAHYIYTNLFASELIPDGYQETGAFSIGKSKNYRPALNLNLAYQHAFTYSRFSRFTWGIMANYNGGTVRSGIISVSGRTVADPSLAGGTGPDHEVFSSFGATGHLTSKHHWSIGPSIIYKYKENISLFGKLSYHQLRAHMDLASTTPDVRYTVAPLINVGTAFSGAGLALGGTIGPKQGWYLQPEAEYVVYGKKSFVAPHLTQGPYEVTYSSTESYQVRTYDVRLCIGYRF